MNRLRNLWDALRTSLWLVPSGFLGLAVVLRWAAVELDALLADPEALRRWWLHGGSGDDARNLLSTLVTSLITMATLVFSITIVVLTLAANQYGSRLVRTYVSDVRTQLALGTFVMAILYCLLTLRSVEQAMEPAEVPHVAVSLALLLGVLCLFVLLVFLHHVARTIVADEVVHRVASDLEQAAERLLPPAGACATAPDAKPAAAGRSRATIRSEDEGYVQSIDHGALVDAAARREAVVELECRAGDFQCRGGWLAHVHPPDAVDAEFAGEIRGATTIGRYRTPVQDIEFSIRHLVDVALRALSPGINDPHTAMAVVDRLRSALGRIFDRELPRGVHADRDGTIRVSGPASTYDGVLDAAFHEIRRSAAPHPAVVVHLLDALARLAEHARSHEQREGLRRHARLVLEAGLAGTSQPADRADVERAHARAERKLRGPAVQAAGGASCG